MATMQRTSLDTYVLPRVNLLPPEIGEKRAERRSYALMGVAVAGAGAAVVAMYFGQASRVSSAKAERAETQAEQTRLSAERSKLQSVEDVYAAVEADEAVLTKVYSNRVLWSAYLHNISITIPQNVWITQLATTNATTAAPAAGKAAAGAAVVPAGSMTVAGKAFAFNDVAAWLESFSKLNGAANTSFTSAEETTATSPGARSLITFTSSTNLTPAALTPHKKPRSK